MQKQSGEPKGDLSFPSLYDKCIDDFWQLNVVRTSVTSPRSAIPPTLP